MFSDPQEKILTVKNYANTRSVNIVLEKGLQITFEKTADELDSKADILVNSILLLIL